MVAQKHQSLRFTFLNEGFFSTRILQTVVQLALAAPYLCY
jgi:hypothetical protein